MFLRRHLAVTAELFWLSAFADRAEALPEDSTSSSIEYLVDRQQVLRSRPLRHQTDLDGTTLSKTKRPPTPGPPENRPPEPSKHRGSHFIVAPDKLLRSPFKIFRQIPKPDRLPSYYTHGKERDRKLRSHEMVGLGVEALAAAAEAAADAFSDTVSADRVATLSDWMGGRDTPQIQLQ